MREKRSVLVGDLVQGFDVVHRHIGVMQPLATLDVEDVLGQHLPTLLCNKDGGLQNEINLKS